MKYIDADLLRKEIKRRRLHFNKEAEKYQALNNGYSQNCYGARDALRDLENFLDTLSEEPDKSLEEAAEDYVMDNIPDFNPELYDGSLFREEDMNHAFIAGAEWQKNQMLKDAVEGLICATLTGTKAISFLSLLPIPKGLTVGDKVRIVILKEEE